MKVDYIPIMCDNMSAVNNAKNPVHHKHTKHIDIRHHFLRDNVEKEFIEMVFCKTEDQMVNFFTKDIARDNFKLNHLHLGLIKRI